MRLTVKSLFFTLSIFFLSACGDAPQSSDHQITAYVGATMITGADRAPIENSVLLVRDGVILEAGARGQVDIPGSAEIVDLNGKYIMPGLINAHGHVGMADGLETGPEVYTRENVRSQLLTYAQYGITTVISLGDGQFSGTEYRDEIVNDPAPGIARFFLAGPVISAETPDEAREAVREHHEAGVDWIKIRIDSGLGTRVKMAPEVYRAIAEEAARLEMPSAAHIVELEDALGAAEAGFSLIAHSVRDKPVSPEFVEVMQERNIPLTPTLTREISTFIYRERPGFFDNEFFQRTADPDVLEELQTEEVQQRFAESESGRWFEDQLPVALDNMMELYNAGVIIALGTDSGPPARFQGYFEHLEMQMMQEAGMAPGQIIQSATSLAARAAGIDHLTGELKSGLAADFILLGKNPTEDILNLREIEAVYVQGNPVEMPQD